VRASENFNVSGIGIHYELNRAIVEIKKAAAKANMECGVLDRKIGNVIIKACNEVLRGKYEDQFVLDVYQAGAGTPWNMNVNEVIANIALEILGKKKGSYEVVDPHDHVNMSQSSNDVIISATRIASLILIEKFLPELERLIGSLKRKSREFRKLAKSGRTHYRDAVPITLGQEFGAWASDLEKRSRVIKDSKKNLTSVPLGGTAVGTGFNAPKGFDKKVVGYLNKNLKKSLNARARARVRGMVKVSVRVAKNKIEELQFMSDLLDLSAALRSLVVDLNKICGDIMFLSSGPRTGLGEIILPKIEPGSSIMPGKFNPSMAEMLRMVCDQVIGNDEAIKEAAKDGNLELNVNAPVIAHNLLQDLDMLRNGIREFNDKCISGIKADKERLKEYFEKTPSLGAVLNRVIGYDKAAEVVKEAVRSKKSVKKVVIEKGILSKKEADKIFKRENFGLG